MGVALSSMLNNTEHVLNHISARTREGWVQVVNLTLLKYRETGGMGIDKEGFMGIKG